MAKTAMKNEAIGFDLGKTIFTKAEGIKFPHRGAFRVIKRLITERFGHRSYIVSKVTPEHEIIMRAFLKEEGLCELTGLNPENVHYCRERVDKAPICDELGITHFVDDRPEVLSHMESVPNRFLFRGIDDDFKKFKLSLKGVVRVDSWRDIEKLLL